MPMAARMSDALFCVSRNAPDHYPDLFTSSPVVIMSRSPVVAWFRAISTGTNNLRAKFSNMVRILLNYGHHALITHWYIVRLALQAQRLSVALHIASAWEIATEMQLAGGGGEAPATA
eukprot:scaffold7539_cov57-Phaeocystis_antarctica.AAC.2